MQRLIKKEPKGRAMHKILVFERMESAKNNTEIT